jgi:hypothetical protein
MPQYPPMQSLPQYPPMQSMPQPPMQPPYAPMQPPQYPPHMSMQQYPSHNPPYNPQRAIGCGGASYAPQPQQQVAPEPVYGGPSSSRGPFPF